MTQTRGTRREDLWDNPMGTDGFAFVEFTGPQSAALDDLFRRMGFSPVGKHTTRDITLYRQGNVSFLLNADADGPAAAFAAAHGQSVSAIAFHVEDAGRVLKVPDVTARAGSLALPAIEGIGGALLYLADRDPFAEFALLPDADPHPKGHGLRTIDHLTHNVHRGNMTRWAGFYERIFNFREVRYFDIEGKLTGLRSQAMTSPDGKIRIPINESADDKSQIEEYLRAYNGEGVQHVALSTGGLVETVEAMRAAGVVFLDTPDTYYELVDRRVPGHGLDLAPLQKNRILIDGAPAKGEGLLLQIFTENVIGPVFFELIERHGNEGFGEGNFRALFESIELDQIRRGVLRS